MKFWNIFSYYEGKSFLFVTLISQVLQKQIKHSMYLIPFRIWLGSQSYLLVGLTNCLNVVKVPQKMPRLSKDFNAILVFFAKIYFQSNKILTLFGF